MPSKPGKAGPRRRRVNAQCSGAFPQGQFICPEEVQLTGSPEKAKPFLGCKPGYEEQKAALEKRLDS